MLVTRGKKIQESALFYFESTEVQMEDCCLDSRMRLNVPNKESTAAAMRAPRELYPLHHVIITSSDQCETNYLLLKTIVANSSQETFKDQL